MKPAQPILPQLSRAIKSTTSSRKEFTRLVDDKTIELIDQFFPWNKENLDIERITEVEENLERDRQTLQCSDKQREVKTSVQSQTLEKDEEEQEDVEEEEKQIKNENTNPKLEEIEKYKRTDSIKDPEHLSSVETNSTSNLLALLRQPQDKVEKVNRELDTLAQEYSMMYKEANYEKQLINIEKIFQERDLNTTMLSLFTEQGHSTQEKSLLRNFVSKVKNIQKKRLKQVTPQFINRRPSSDDLLEY